MATVLSVCSHSLCLLGSVHLKHPQTSQLLSTKSCTGGFVPGGEQNESIFFADTVRETLAFSTCDSVSCEEHVKKGA